MVNRKSAAKQAAGGASRSPNLQPANKNRSTGTGVNTPISNKPSSFKAQTRTTPLKPLQLAAIHPSNGTKPQGTGNGPPKSRGANGQSFLKPQTPKPKHSQPLTRARNSVLSSPPRPGTAQPPSLSGVHGNKAGQKVFQDQSSTPKQSGYPYAHTQKAQNHALTPQNLFSVSQTHQQPTNSGKNATHGPQKVQTTTQHAPRGGQSAKAPKSPSHNHKASSHSDFAQATYNNEGHKNNLPKPTVNSWSVGQINVPFPTKNVTPPPKASPSISGLSKDTGSRPFDSMNSSGSKRNSSSSSYQAKLSVKQSPAVAEGSGSWDSLRSWLPNAGWAVQATKTLMPNLRKVKGLESLPNGSQTRQIQVSNLPMLKGGVTNVLPKNGSTPNKSSTPANDKVRPQFWQVPKTSNKGNNNGGRNELPLIPFKNELTWKQLVPSAQDILTAKISPAQTSPHSQLAKDKGFSLKQGVIDASQKRQAAAAPILSLGRMLNQVSSFFSWTKTAPSAPPINKRVQVTNIPWQGDVNPPKSHPAPTSTSTAPRHKHPELSRKEVVLSAARVRNGLHDVRDPSGKSNTSASGTKLSWMQSLMGSKIVSSHATNRAQKSSTHQSVQGLSTVKATKPTSVPRRKEFRIESNSSKALSPPPRKTTTFGKDLLRQYSPNLIWRASDSPKVISAYSTITAAPLPPPPRNELQNQVACKTIAQNPNLFKIVSPIKIDALARNVRDHPNQPFVRSVIRALKRGFWPWANTSNAILPTTYDGSHLHRAITSKKKLDFIRQQRDEEVGLRRWSKPFSTKLLPGMHSAPINAIPKSTPGKYRLINDQSCGPHALNSTIPKSQVKIKLDTIHDLGNALLAVRKKHPKARLCLFKSDVKSAYRQLPMHPLWQIKQVVSIDGQRYVDRCNTFGNRGGGWNWDSVASLVNWIGTEKKRIPDLLGYVDDNFGWEFEGNKTYYKPYKKLLPAKQTRLLELWDELGIPHNEDKQLSGPCLPIIGYEVDANAMTVKLPNEKKAKVIQLLRNYAQEGKYYTLKELQSVAGSTNEVLSLYPRLRPGLRDLFNEMAGKTGSRTKLKVTRSVARSLSELARHLEHVRPVPIQQKKQSMHGLRAKMG